MQSLNCSRGICLVRERFWSNRVPIKGCQRESQLRYLEQGEEGESTGLSHQGGFGDLDFCILSIFAVKKKNGEHVHQVLYIAAQSKPTNKKENLNQ